MEITRAAYEELLRRIDKKGSSMPEENTGEIEVDGPGGLKARARGYRLQDLLLVPMVIGIGYLVMIHAGHAADTKEEKAAIAKALTESNTTIANALKESNATTVQAIRELATEQRKSTDAIREIACLSDPAMRNRTDAREFCKRMSRDSR